MDRKAKIIQLLEGSIWDSGLGTNFLGKTSELQSIKEQSDKLDFSA